jgi:hypothetical protein
VYAENFTLVGTINLFNMKTTLKNTTICIEKLLFNEPGKITIKMEDGRLFIIPLK